MQPHASVSDPQYDQVERALLSGTQLCAGQLREKLNSAHSADES
jgi:hypothetical protein